MQGFAPIMWSVWGVLVLFVLALKVYSGRLTRDEDDQLILDDSFNHVKNEQAAMMAKVQKIEPITRVALWITAAMTLVVIGYYVMDFMNQFK
jgi:hypothetical protein